MNTEEILKLVKTYHCRYCDRYESKGDKCEKDCEDFANELKALIDQALHQQLEKVRKDLEMLETKKDSDIGVEWSDGYMSAIDDALCLNSLSSPKKESNENTY